MPAKCKINRLKKRRRIYLRDMGICQLCKEFVEYAEISLDHIIPLSKGGSSDEDNLQVTHTWCNWIKGNNMDELTVEYFKSHIQYGKYPFHKTLVR